MDKFDLSSFSNANPFSSLRCPSSFFTAPYLFSHPPCPLATESVKFSIYHHRDLLSTLIVLDFLEVRSRLYQNQYFQLTYFFGVFWSLDSFYIGANLYGFAELRKFWATFSAISSSFQPGGRFYNICQDLSGVSQNFTVSPGFWTEWCLDHNWLETLRFQLVHLCNLNSFGFLNSLYSVQDSPTRQATLQPASGFSNMFTSRLSL